MKPSEFFSIRRLFFGFTGIAVLATIFAPSASYAMSGKKEASLDSKKHPRVQPHKQTEPIAEDEGDEDKTNLKTLKTASLMEANEALLAEEPPILCPNLDLPGDFQSFAEGGESLTFFKTLSFELYQEILKHLPFEALRNLRQVNRLYWRNTFSIDCYEKNNWPDLPAFLTSLQHSKQLILLRLSGRDPISFTHEAQLKVPGAFLESIIKLPKLMGLHLPGSFPEQAEPLLSNLRHLEHLKSLDLCENNIGAAVAAVLAQSKTLTTLILYGNKIGAVGAASLAQSKTLTTLDLQSNNIGDVGTASLAENRILRTLSLWNNQIGDAGATSLAANSTLATLNLYGNNIGAAGAMSLATNRTLTKLDLSGNNIGDTGAKALVEAFVQMNLQSLGLSSNNLSKAVKEELRRQTYRNAKGEEVKIEI